MYVCHVLPTEVARPGHFSYQGDEGIVQALVTAGAMVAIADGSVARVERDEFVNFIDRQRFVPSIPQGHLAAAFDARLRELDDRNAPDIIMEGFRPLAGLSRGSVVMRVAQRVAAADGRLYHRERQTMDLIRLILTNVSFSGRRRECRLPQPTAAAPSMLHIWRLRP